VYTGTLDSTVPSETVTLLYPFGSRVLRSGHWAMFPREREGFDRPRFIMSPVPPCGKQSPVVLELASFQWLVNLLEAASTLGTAATLHWLGDGRVGGSVGWVGGRDPPIHPPPNRLSGYP